MNQSAGESGWHPASSISWSTMDALPWVMAEASRAMAQDSADWLGREPELK